MKLCIHCGNEIGDQDTICSFCGSDQTKTSEPVEPVIAKPIHPIAGSLGALVGVIIGGASIVLLGQLGYIAGICGFIMAICTLKGYELLGGGMNMTGVIVSAVLMLIAPYIAYRLSLSISIVNELKEVYQRSIGLGEVFARIPELTADPEIRSEYLMNLGTLYLFTILGGAGILWRARKA